MWAAVPGPGRLVPRQPDGVRAVAIGVLAALGGHSQPGARIHCGTRDATEPAAGARRQGPNRSADLR